MSNEATTQTQEPQVGMGVTMRYFSDCYPGTIIHVTKSGKTIQVQEDTATIISGSGYDGSAEYSYTPNPEGAVTTFTLRKGGRWVRKGETLQGGCRAGLGHRRMYQDPSF